ncbi:hypothetical protein HU200_047610 [Digitaria exilis]|uniref:Uncharacterized protein n=1 Tax=Digitaria exilis TaxID=1010633 RepID=A0A835AV50_9POAL|nr:hypothetical protein HU200_047610 [Digitaria exilis]
MKEQLGEKTMLQSIRKAGHLVHLERPCVYNRLLTEFLASVTYATRLGRITYRIHHGYTPDTYPPCTGLMGRIGP